MDLNFITTDNQLNNIISRPGWSKVLDLITSKRLGILHQKFILQFALKALAYAGIKKRREIDLEHGDGLCKEG